MKKIFISILLLTAVCFNSGCMPEDDNIWDSASLVEFKNHLFGRVAASQPAGVTSNAVLARQISMASRGTDSVLVQLVGPQSSSDTEINFTVVGESTAVAGENYSFVNSGTSVTIPANSSSGYILINPVTGSITSGSRTLILELTGNDLITPSENYKRFTITMVP